MLRLPAFELAEPSSLEEALALLKKHQDRARPLAGGTDLLPNMKHQIEQPALVVGLRKLSGLKQVLETDTEIRIGALNTLHDLGQHPTLLRHLPMLAEAVNQVSGPQLRRMGTIGGNVCLDTRCVYINQTYFWRQALGFCLKKDGTTCHVVAGGSRCVAAASNDSAPVLMSLGATLVLQSLGVRRELSIDDFYSTDGIFNQKRARDELLTEIVIPKPRAGTLMAYEKLRTRAAIDFPELGVAVLAELSPKKEVERVEICVTALGARPVRVKKLETIARNKRLDAALIAELAEAAFVRCKPLTNIGTEPAYRRKMVRVFVKRAFSRALSRGVVAASVA